MRKKDKSVHLNYGISRLSSCTTMPTNKKYIKLEIDPLQVAILSNNDMATISWLKQLIKAVLCGWKQFELCKPNNNFYSVYIFSF